MRAAGILLGASLALAAPVASAQVLDQAQETWDDSFPISSSFSAWQVFTAARSGPLTTVELPLVLACFFPSCDGATDLVLDVVAVSAGVPTSIPLGAALVPPSAASTDDPEWVSIPLAGVTVEAGTAYAIHLSAGVPGSDDFVWNWPFLQSQAYAGGDFFTDPDPSNGQDDPTTANTPSMDAAFRTFVLDQVCGDGTEQAPEDCDDGNTVSGDGCSAACTLETCGDGLVNDGEACDDGAALSGDGCSATCTLEPAAAACRAAIAKGGSRYAAARLAALLKCRNLLAAGRRLSVSDPGACPSETAAARSIAKAAAQTRKTIAAARQPKCTDALVAPLPTCGDTVDALVAADAASGCLLAEQDAQVDESLADFGY
jgi:cysteine-rich repeat protein